MSYNGSGTFVINTAGQPVVSGTVISSTAFNALTADLATGLSTAITKDGQTTPTANIPMGNNKITGLAVGTAATDAANLSQVQSTTAKLINSISGTDTITGTMSPTLGAYAAGQMFYFIAAGDNTGAVTLNIDSLGAKAVTRDGSVALAASDLKSGEVVVVVYDGTRFQVVSQLNSAGDARFANVSITSALNVGGVATFSAGTAAAPSITTSGDTNTGIFFPAADTIAFTEGGVEALRIDSSANVGIGTSSPAYKLQVNGTTTGDLVQFTDGTFQSIRFGTTTTGIYYNNPNGGYQAWNISGTERLRLDASGSLGLGVTPSAWDAAEFRPVEMGTIGNFVAGYVGSSVAYIGTNAYYNGGWKYARSSVEAAHIDIGGGAFRFKTAGTGTAGNAITWTQAMTLDASGNLIVGGTSAINSAAGRGNITINGSSNAILNFGVGGAEKSYIYYTGTDLEIYNTSNNAIKFGTNNTERARITSGGDLCVGKSSSSSTTAGGVMFSNGRIDAVTSGSACSVMNRLTNDGTLIEFQQDNSIEGTISVSGNTVSYNAFAGSHWSQLQDGSKPDILRGTVMESINELCVWPGEQNERLPKSKVSDTAGSKKVYGVFMAWDNDWTETNDMYVTAVGAFICRVNGSVTVEEGDLLESNGDGTARVQADDIIRSSTIGKVTSTVKTHEYDDGSYCVPTVLYCG